MPAPRYAQPKARPRPDRGRPRPETHPTAGFTLVETMMAIAILAILVAMSIPFFRNASDDSSDRAIQSNLRTSLEAVMHIYADVGEFTDDLAVLEQEESSIAWTHGVPQWETGSETVRVRVSADGNVVCVDGESTTNHSFSIKRIAEGPNAGTYFGSFADRNAIECENPPLDNPLVIGDGSGTISRDGFEEP